MLAASVRVSVAWWPEYGPSCGPAALRVFAVLRHRVLAHLLLSDTSTVPRRDDLASLARLLLLRSLHRTRFSFVFGTRSAVLVKTCWQKSRGLIPRLSLSKSSRHHVFGVWNGCVRRVRYCPRPVSRLDDGPRKPADRASGAACRQLLWRALPYAATSGLFAKTGFPFVGCFLLMLVLGVGRHATTTIRCVVCDLRTLRTLSFRRHPREPLDYHKLSSQFVALHGPCRHSMRWQSVASASLDPSLRVSECLQLHPAEPRVR